MSLILSAVILLKLIQLKVLLTVLLVSICQRSFEDFFPNDYTFKRLDDSVFPLVWRITDSNR